MPLEIGRRFTAPDRARTLRADGNPRARPLNLPEEGCTVIARADPFVTTQAGKYGRTARNRGRSLVRCDCGNEFVVLNDCLTGGQTWCCRTCANKRLFRKHGHAGKDHKARSRTYRIWLCMKQRCYNPKAPKFKNHGGRGITVCERWRNSFEAFLEDMGECPPGLSIDRWPDRDGNYEPGNCRWATDSEQNRNSRRNIVLSVQGRTGCLVELCEHFGLDYNFVYGRLRIGWPAEAAFFIPKMSKHESGKCRWRV